MALDDKVELSDMMKLEILKEVVKECCADIRRLTERVEQLEGRAKGLPVWSGRSPVKVPASSHAKQRNAGRKGKALDKIFKK